MAGDHGAKLRKQPDLEAFETPQKSGHADDLVLSALANSSGDPGKPRKCWSHK